MTQVKFTVTDNMPSLLVYLWPLQNSAIPYGPRREKTCLLGCVNNKDADQPAGMSDQRLCYSLIGKYKYHIYGLATIEITIF